jgi:hypothetical protein
MIRLRCWDNRSPTRSVVLRIGPRYQVHGKKPPRRCGEVSFGQAGMSALGVRPDAGDGKVLGDRENPVVGFQHNMVHPLERLTSQLRLAELPLAEPPGVAYSGRFNHWRVQRFAAACRQ